MSTIIVLICEILGAFGKVRLARLLKDSALAECSTDDELSSPED